VSKLEEAARKRLLKIEWHKIFDYDKSNGNLLWKPFACVHQSKKRLIGKVAGSVKTRGYISITYRRKEYRRARIVYVMFNGTIPKGKVIDHINGITSDDRISNLRAVSVSENGRNRVEHRNGKTCGIHQGKLGNFQASGFRNGKRKYLGMFSNKSEAEDAIRRYEKR
jgi:hypothetical protein